MSKAIKPKTKVVILNFEVMNILTFEEIIEVPIDATEEQIEEAADKWTELLNWGDLGDMFNMIGPPEFQLEGIDTPITKAPVARLKLENGEFVSK